MLERAADSIIEDAATQWGSSPAAFPHDVRSAYAAALAHPDHAHAICEEYRAAASIDREHDDADLLANRKITCPTLILWAKDNALDHWYRDAGGPLALWRQWAANVTGEAVEGGHFFPEVYPAETAERLNNFLRPTFR